MKITKHSKNLGTLEIYKIDKNLAKSIVMENHYSKTWNSAFGTICFGIFKEGVLFGVAVFGSLMNPKSFHQITDYGQESLIELNRLWISDELGKNAETLFLGACFNIIKKTHPEIKFIQSFADGRLGCGTIYKASNFKYYGFHYTLFWEHSHSKVVYHKVLLENTKNINTFKKLNKMFLDNELMPFKVKTYRYIYQLGKEQCKLKEQKYPPYNKGYEYINHSFPLGHLCRLRILYEFFGEYEYVKKIDVILDKRYTKEQIDTEMAKQKENEHIAKVINKSTDSLSDFMN